jgi:hypothetical protein
MGILAPFFRQHFLGLGREDPNDKSFLTLKNETASPLWFQFSKLCFSTSNYEVRTLFSGKVKPPEKLEPGWMVGVELQATAVYTTNSGVGQVTEGFYVHGECFLKVWRREPGKKRATELHRINVSIHLRRDIAPQAGIKAGWERVARTTLDHELELEEMLEKRVYSG